LEWEGRDETCDGRIQRMLRLQDREFNDAGATKTRLQRERDAPLQQPGIVKCEELSKRKRKRACGRRMGEKWQSKATMHL
jgi:hypothetical protein